MDHMALIEKLESWIDKRDHNVYAMVEQSFDSAEPSIRAFLGRLVKVNELIVKKYSNTDVAYFHDIIKNTFAYWGNRMLDEGKTDLLEKYPGGPDGLPEPVYPDPIKL